MKKIIMLFAAVVCVALTAMAQKEPYKVVSMEDVVKFSSNCEYDTETCTASFVGPYNRWFDIPGISGDLREHSMVNLDVLQSNIILKFVVRYRDAEGKTQEFTSATLYGQMGNGISKKKTLKLDLAGKDGENRELLENVIAIRISMAKAIENAEEPWSCQFGTKFMLF